MSAFRFGKMKQTEPPDESAEAGEQGSETVQAEAGVVGERGITSVNRARSIQSRMSSILALALMSVLGLSLLGWYYARVAARPAQAQKSAEAAAKHRAQGEMPLPALGRIEPPTTALKVSTVQSAGTDGGLAEAVLGPAPPLPPEDDFEATTYVPSAVPVMTASPVVPDRRLAGPVFSAAPTPMEQGSTSAFTQPSAGAPLPGAALANESVADVGTLSDSLRPTPTAAVRAQVLPTQRLLLPKGAFLDCTLETAIDSTLPGMTTCVLATDTFSADGKVVLLERGTKLVGETGGQVAQGAARVFVLWTQARTPTGVVVALASPGTDELGRSGLAGEVNRHFWQRFGAAILVSVIDGAVQSAVQSSNDSGTVVYSPSTSQTVMTEVLKGTINIPPTITKQNGDRIQVLVARDLDFRSVYELRAATSAD